MSSFVVTVPSWAMGAVFTVMVKVVEADIGSESEVAVAYTLTITMPASPVFGVPAKVRVVGVNVSHCGRLRAV